LRSIVLENNGKSNIIANNTQFPVHVFAYIFQFTLWVGQLYVRCAARVYDLRHEPDLWPLYYLVEHEPTMDQVSSERKRLWLRRLWYHGPPICSQPLFRRRGRLPVRIKGF